MNDNNEPHNNKLKFEDFWRKHIFYDCDDVDLRIFEMNNEAISILQLKKILEITFNYFNNKKADL